MNNRLGVEGNLLARTAALDYRGIMLTAVITLSCMNGDFRPGVMLDVCVVEIAKAGLVEESREWVWWWGKLVIIRRVVLERRAIETKTRLEGQSFGGSSGSGQYLVPVFQSGPGCRGARRESSA